MQSNNIQRYSVPASQGTQFSGAGPAQSIGPSDASRVTSDTTSRSSSNVNALTLEVVNVNRNSLQLQIQGSQERLSLPMASVEIDGKLNKGDVVLLTSVKNNTAKLIVIDNLGKASNAKPDANLSLPLLRKLAANWPQITAAELNQTKITPVYETSIGNTQVQTKLMDWLVKNAASELQAKSVVLDVKITRDALNNSSFNVTGSGAQVLSKAPFNLTLTQPIKAFAHLNKQVTGKIELNATINAGKLQVQLSKLTFDKKQLAQELLRQINQSFTKTDAIAIENAFKRGFLSTASTSPDQQNLVLKPDAKLFSLLQARTQKDIASSDVDLQAVLSRSATRSNVAPQFLVYAKPTVISATAENILSKLSIHQSTGSQGSLNGTHNMGLQSNGNVAKQSTDTQRLSSVDNKSIRTNESSITANASRVDMLKQHIADRTSQVSARVSDTDRALTSALGALARTVQSTSGESRRMLTELMGEKLLGALDLQRLSKPPNTQQSEVAQKPVSNAVNTKQPVSQDGTRPESHTNQATTDKSTIQTDLIRQILQEQLPLLQANIIHQNTSNALANNDSMMGGLLNLLSLRLLSKLDGELKNSLASLPSLRRALQGVTGPVNTLQARNTAAELDQLDANNELLKSLKNATARLHSNALRSTESTVQQQDALHFSLPNIMHPQQKDIELRIRAINDDERNQHPEPHQRSWLIDMRLDIGDEGDVLAKIKLTGEVIRLNLYASDQALMKKTNRLLPKLTARLSAFGMHVAEQQCYFSQNTDFAMNQRYDHPQSYTEARA